MLTRDVESRMLPIGRGCARPKNSKRRFDNRRREDRTSRGVFVCPSIQEDGSALVAEYHRGESLTRGVVEDGSG